MIREEAEKRTKIITMMLAVYGNSQDKTMIASYVELLGGIPVELLEKACRKVSLESEYQPRPAAIINAAKSLIGSVGGSRVKPFNEAWKEIEKEMKDTFVYGEPNFSTPEITEAVKCFGWNELCSVLTKDLPIVRAQLRDIYNMVCEQKKEETVNNHVLGRGALIERIGTDGEIRKLS